MKKRLWALGMAVVVMVSALTGCQSSTKETTSEAAKAVSEVTSEATKAAEAAPTETAATTEKRTIRVAWTLEQLTEGTSGGVQIIQERIKEINAERDDIYIEPLTVYAADYKLDKQLTDIETIISTKPDVMIISAVDSKGVVPGIEAAAKAGITVVDWRGTIESDAVACTYVGIDEELSGQLIKEWTIEYLNENPEAVLNIGLMYHDTAVVACFPRLWGLVELAEEMPDRVKILDEVYTSKQDEAMRIMEDWMQVYPEMNYIAGGMGEAVLGAVNVVKAANKLDDFVFATVDGQATCTKAVVNEEITCMIGIMHPVFYGGTIDTAIGVLLGEVTDKVVYMECLEVVTKDNVDDFINRRFGEDFKK